MLHFFLFIIGPPIFAVSNRRTQEGTKGSTIKVRVNVYNSSHEITCTNIIEIGSLSVITKDIEVNINQIHINESFYGALITVPATEIIFLLKGLKYDRIRKFNITLCNSIGKSSFVVVSKPTGKI